MHSQNFFFQAFIYLTAAVFSVPIAKRLGLGSILGYLLAGIIIGPYVFNLVGEEGTDVMNFAEFGVVMMLFLIGLELRPSLLWRMRKSIFGLGGLQVLISTILIAIIALFFDMKWPQAIAIGLIFALSSTAIVLQSLTEKKLLSSQAGKSSFSVLLFQDIAVIPILAILPILANIMNTSNGHQHLESASGDHSFVTALPGWQQLILIIGVVVVIILVGRYFVRYIFRFIASTGLREIFTATALLLVIAIALAADSVGLSPALGTFLAGVVLADNEYRHELETDIEPFKGLLLGLFFIAVGSSIDFNILVDKPSLVFMLLGILLFVKFTVLFLLGRRFRLKSGQDMLFAFALAQAGEFGFVLISFSSQNAIISDDVSGILLMVIALSMLITPLLLIINDKLVQHLYVKSEKVKQPDDIQDNENPVILAGFGRFGLVIGRFLKANGIKTTILDNNPDNIKTLRQFGFKVYYGDASRHDLLETAGVKSAKIFIMAIDDEEKSLEMIDYLQNKYPHLKIFARSFDIKNSYELMKREITGHQRETYHSALELGKKILISMGFSVYQTFRAANTFKYHDKEVILKLFSLWDKDKRSYIKEAKRFREELEKVLLAEHENSIHESDSAWDISARREEVKELYSKLDEDKG